MLEELCGKVEVGELSGFGGDGAVRVGELRTEAADGGLERGERGSESGQSVVGVVEGGKLREEIVVPREDLRAELVLEEADRVVELLGGGGRGSRGEGGGGEGGGGEGRGEEGGEDGIQGERIEGRGRRGGDARSAGGGTLEGGEALHRGCAGGYRRPCRRW